MLYLSEVDTFASLNSTHNVSFGQHCTQVPISKCSKNVRVYKSEFGGLKFFTSDISDAPWDKVYYAVPQLKCLNSGNKP